VQVNDPRYERGVGLLKLNGVVSLFGRGEGGEGKWPEMVMPRRFNYKASQA